MIVRDLDLLVEGAARADVSVTFSVPTLDEEIWRRTEPGTAPPRQRLRALRELVGAGVKAGVGMAPILPGLSDRPELLRDVVRAAREAGATGVWANLLYLKPGTREHFLEALARDWPEQLPRYEELYEGRAYLPHTETQPVREQVRELARAHGIRDRRTPPARRAQPQEPAQLRLAV
jgi:DNA repair photolyase